jgi:hypothetical protein
MKPADKPANMVPDAEFEACQVVYSALVALDVPARSRVLRYVAERLGLAAALEPTDSVAAAPPPEPLSVAAPSREVQSAVGQAGADVDGISPIATKWITRSALNLTKLSRVFSIGAEEIDLIAESVPGKSKRARLHSVLLLKAIASYLSTGVPRVADQELREVAAHYDAKDDPNFAANLKGAEAYFTGNKQSGYTLTARGLTEAARILSADMKAGNDAKS